LEESANAGALRAQASGAPGGDAEDVEGRGRITAWMLVLSEVSGGDCEVLVFDRERRRCMEAVGHDARGRLGHLRARVLEQTRGCDDGESLTIPDAVASFWVLGWIL